MCLGHLWTSLETGGPLLDAHGQRSSRTGEKHVGGDGSLSFWEDCFSSVRYRLARPRPPFRTVYQALSVIHLLDISRSLHVRTGWGVIRYNVVLIWLLPSTKYAQLSHLVIGHG